MSKLSKRVIPKLQETWNVMRPVPRISGLQEAEKDHSWKDLGLKKLKEDEFHDHRSMDVADIMNSPTRKYFSHVYELDGHANVSNENRSYEAAGNKQIRAEMTNVRPAERNLSKIAIPRVRVTATKTRCRISHACTSCQGDKIKCDGDQPRCEHCVMSGKQCHYRPRKHLRMKG
jgi:hypothetical protein